MSFFRKDYSTYPQPVVVKSDSQQGEDSVLHGTASTSLSSDSLDQRNTTPRTSALSDINKTPLHHQYEEEEEEEEEEQRGQRHEHSDSQGDGSSTHTNTRDSQTIPQQQLETSKLADGIMSLLGPIVQEMDFNIVSVRKSQSELEKEIERLMAELQLFMASSACPPEVEPAVQKLIKARRQIMTANSTLKSVQDRVDKMHSRLERRQ
ncbi:hypothetical protein BGZ83_001313 [Gryganskiella cystojenkinii]|nr:hypothetical protein BGZ83_001313 [Gryganskiella cystojenkinii]